MPTLARDTSPEAERILIELWRKRTSAQQLQSIVTMRQMARELILSDLREKHPRADQNQLNRLLLARMAGEEISSLLQKGSSSFAEGQMLNELEILFLVTKRLEELKLPYFISGSMASIKYGEPRFTRDADIVIRMLPVHVAEFVKKFEADFAISADAVQEALQRRYAIQLIHFDTAFKIDLFSITEQDELEISAFARRQRHDLGGGEVWMASAEDIILAKLRWFQLGGGVSEVQWRDVLGVLKVQGDALDFQYLAEQAHQFDLFDLLAKARRDAE